MATTTNQTIDEVITRSKTEGFNKSIEEAKRLDAELNQVVKTGDRLEKSQLSNARAQERFNKKYEEGYRAAAEFNKQQKILQQSLEQGRFGEGAEAVAEYERKLTLLKNSTIDYTANNDNMIKSTAKIENSFGLARHQVQNLTAQFVDLGVQLSAGGGILLPLIQQGPQAIQAVGGVSNAISVARQAFAGLSTTSKGLIVGAGGLTIFGLIAQQAVSFSKAFAELVQPERTEQAIERYSTSFDKLADAFDRLFNRAPSNLFIDAMNRAHDAMDAVTAAIERTIAARDRLAQQPTQIRTPYQQFLDRQNQAAMGLPTTPQGFNLPLPALPPRLPSELMAPIELGGGGELGKVGSGLFTEGRKELIDGVTKGFEKVMSGIGHEITSMSGDVRVWGRKLDENTQSTRDGLSSVETAVYGVSGAVSRWGLVSKEAIDTLTQATIAAAQARYGAFAGPTGGFDSDAAFEAAWLEFFGTPLSGTTKGTGGSSTTGGTITARYSEDPNSLRSRFNRGVATARSGGVPYAGETMAATASGTSTISDMTSPISREIDALRSLQEAVMQRDYRPDPYSDKNPDIFYGAGRQFRAEQDKQFNALQDQIDQLQSIQGLTATLVNQGASLPQMLVNALLAAGFGNLAAEISAGIARSITTGTTSTTTTGTAQMGPLANRYGSTSFRANIV